MRTIPPLKNVYSPLLNIYVPCNNDLFYNQPIETSSFLKLKLIENASLPTNFTQLQ